MVTDLLPLFPFLLGYLTQEELIALKKKQARVRTLRIGALVIGLIILFSTKPWEQPDTAHKEPKLAHIDKPERLVESWMIDVKDGIFVAKISTPGGPGGNFDDERFWRERLEQLISYIILLRESGYLYEAETLLELNGWMLKEIFAICDRFHINLHEVLSRAFGKDYVINVVLIRMADDYIDAVVVVFPDITLGQVVDKFEEILETKPGELVGAIRVSGIDGETVFTELFYAEKIIQKAWKSITNTIKKFFDQRPPPLQFPEREKPTPN